jgi:hypothetical protein
VRRGQLEQQPPIAIDDQQMPVAARAAAGKASLDVIRIRRRGIRNRVSAEMKAADFGSIGALVMSWFHPLSDGNSWRPPKSSVSTTLA